MSKHTGELVFVPIIRSEPGNPSGVLADAEVIVEVDTARVGSHWSASPLGSVAMEGRT